MIDGSRPVRVFRNWKHDCYTIMQDGRVCASARQVLLRDVSFLVRPGGRARMLRLNRKIVHAYAVGRLEAHVHPDDPLSIEPLEGRSAFYDAYRYPHFADSESHQPVMTAEAAYLSERGLTYRPHGLPVAA